ncbi:hypothetical protein F4810DRAFT_682048 [Camillea tinctor]|nr:hypothetical protein F4810DRAFT_682048 [Camillea tinctor]
MAHEMVTFQLAVSRLSKFFGEHIFMEQNKYFSTNATMEYDNVKPSTRSERIRVDKALYIIDIVHHLFHLEPRHVRFNGKADNEAFGRFWRNFAPWENKQVGTIADWLLAYGKRAYNDGYFNIEWSSDTETVADYQFVMILGIKLMVPLVIREMHDSGLYDLAPDKKLNTSSLKSYEKRWSFEAYELIYWREDGPPGQPLTIYLKDCTYQQYDASRDSGPRDTWVYTFLWQHREHLVASDFLQRNSDPYIESVIRQLAVFWDRERLEEIFGSDFPSYQEMLSKCNQLDYSLKMNNLTTI